MGKIKPGQFPSANEWNRHVDAAAIVMRSALGQGLSFRVNGLSSVGSTVRIKNTSGGAVDRFDILGIDGVIVTPTESLSDFILLTTLDGVTPAIEDHANAFAVLMEPLADDQIGQAVVSGYCQATVNVTDANHNYAKVADSNTTLTSGFDGARILYKESGTGDKTCIILLGGGSSPTRVGKLGSTLANNATGTVTLWSQSSTSAPSATANTEVGINITGVTLQSSVFVKLTDVASFNYPIVEPIEFGTC